MWNRWLNEMDLKIGVYIVWVLYRKYLLYVYVERIEKF